MEFKVKLVVDAFLFVFHPDLGGSDVGGRGWWGFRLLDIGSCSPSCFRIGVGSGCRCYRRICSSGVGASGRRVNFLSSGGLGHCLSRLVVYHGGGGSHCLSVVEKLSGEVC